MMALTIPHYIDAARIQDESIRYPWDDWKENVKPLDKVFLERLNGLAQRAIISFTIGTAEWIVHRYKFLSEDPLPLEYLEAAFAMMIDIRYGGAVWDDHSRESGDWSGPIKRPLELAMIRVEYTFEALLEYGNPELSGAWLGNLAEYIMVDPAPYLKWKAQVMERLESLYPRGGMDALGGVVPREALDPDFDFNIDHTETLINQYLSNLNFQSNRFLNSPQKMINQGFDGKPYAFDIEIDRKTRRKVP